VLQACVLPGDGFPVLALDSPVQSETLSPRGVGELASSCECGGFALWAAASAGSFSARASVATDCPVVALAYTGAFLAAGLSDGRVSLYKQA